MRSAIALALLLASGPGSAAATEPPSPASAERFAGQYDWSDGGKGDLSAEFTPDGEAAWKITFRFEFGGQHGVWEGAGKGPLDEGATLSWTAGASSRRWNWTATLEGGVLRGRHAEVLSDGEHPTGTFELARQDASRER